MKYRPEIDGLRAISVLAVFLFHLGLKSASGGYVGVDVFFVISGYLITTLIYTERQHDQFSMISFYSRRIKRIAPALITVILLTFGLGYLILSPGDYDYLARSGLYSIAGISNFFFLNNTGYFDAAAETMPLLHTWSLAVEEQFYVVWPSLLIVCLRLFEKKKIPVLASILILIATSLALYLLTLQTNPKVAFYMPHTRAWEFLLGGTIPFTPRITSKHLSHLKKALPWFGIAMIGVSIGRIDPEGEFSGYNVIVPIIGAYLIIYEIETKSIIWRILSSKPFTFIGKISYSLYLYHFPMIVLWRHYSGESIVPQQYFLLFILGAIFISWLSWRYIEQPCRRSQLPWKTVFSIFLASEASMACLCATVMWTQGAARRIPDSVQAMRSLDVMWDWPCPSYQTIGGSSFCTGGAAWDAAKAHAVIWGDSNAAQFLPLLDVAGKELGISISRIGSCSPIVGNGNMRLFAGRDPAYMDECDKFSKYAMDAVKENRDISLVILAAAWASVTAALYKNEGDVLGEINGLPLLKAGLDHLLPQVLADGRAVVIMSEMPKWLAEPIPCVVTLQTPLLRSTSFREKCRDKVQSLDEAFFRRDQRRTDDVLRSFNGKDGVIVWSPVDYLCKDQSCTSMINGEFIYRDQGHLRRNLREQTEVELAHLLHFGKLLGLAKRGGIER